MVIIETDFEIVAKQFVNDYDHVRFGKDFWDVSYWKDGKHRRGKKLGVPPVDLTVNEIRDHLKEINKPV